MITGCVSDGFLTVVTPLTRLQRLSFSIMEASNLTPLKASTALQFLDCSHSGVADLMPISALVQMRILDFRGSAVQDLPPLAALTNLQSLNCDFTPVRSLAPISKLTRLQYLQCCYTRIPDASPLTALAALRYLDTSRSPVTDRDRSESPHHSSAAGAVYRQQDVNGRVYLKEVALHADSFWDRRYLASSVRSDGSARAHHHCKANRDSRRSQRVVNTRVY